MSDGRITAYREVAPKRGYFPIGDDTPGILNSSPRCLHEHIGLLSPIDTAVSVRLTRTC